MMKIIVEENYPSFKFFWIYNSILYNSNNFSMFYMEMF